MITKEDYYKIKRKLKNCRKQINKYGDRYDTLMCTKYEICISLAEREYKVGSLVKHPNGDIYEIVDLSYCGGDNVSLFGITEPGECVHDFGYYSIRKNKVIFW